MTARKLIEFGDYRIVRVHAGFSAQEKPPTAPLARLKKAIGVEVPKEPEPESTGGDNLPEIPDDMKEAMR